MHVYYTKAINYFSYIQAFYVFLKVLGFSQLTKHNGPGSSKCHTNAEFIISSLTTVTYSQLNYFKKLKPAMYLSVKWHALLCPLRPGNQDNKQLTVDALKESDLLQVL